VLDNVRIIREEFDLPIKDVLHKIAPLSRWEKRDFVLAFICELNLHVRGEYSSAMLQSVIEIYHRAFEQMNSYLQTEYVERRDEDFLELIYKIASKGCVEGQLKSAICYAMEQLKPERVLN
jgi:hypothetical protein